MRQAHVQIFETRSPIFLNCAPKAATVMLPPMSDTALIALKSSALIGATIALLRWLGFAA